MNTLTKTILMAALLLVMTSAVYAFPRNAASHVQHISQNVDINEEQRVQLTALFEDAHAACESSDNRRACMNERREDVHSVVRTILTKEQLEQLKSARKEKGEESCRRGLKRQRSAE